MAVPKRKTSKSRRNKRRSHHKIIGANVIEDKKTGEYRLPHHVDLKSGFYNGTLFHRIIPGFMIQGGDPNTKDPNLKSQWGMGGPGYNIKAEFNSRSHLRGIISMARSQDPDSAGSQFFIVTSDSTFLDREYTVFGEVTVGMDVADKIVKLPRDGNDCPQQEAKMIKIGISE